MLGPSLFRTGNVGRSGTEFYRFAVVAGSDRLCCGAYRVTEFYRFAFTPGHPLPLGLLYCGYQWGNSLGSGYHPGHASCYTVRFGNLPAAYRKISWQRVHAASIRLNAPR
jgi:hypothetical protein